MKNIGILGIGTHLPSNVITNAYLENIVDTSDEWIRTRTGIQERRFADDDVNTSDMAYLAAVEAINNAGLTPHDIDLIIVATCTPDRSFPSVACMVQEKLGVKNIPAFDMSAACTGFIYSTIMAKQFIETGTHQRVLVIGAEKLSKILDWNDRTTCVLFGDGAGAIVLGEVSSERGILSHEYGADGTGGKHLFEDTHIMMNGREVFKFAARKMPESSLNTLAKAGLTKEDVSLFIPHQANIRIIESAREKLGIAEEKVATTVKYHGNTSAASIPLALAHELQKGHVQEDDMIVMVGFGGGLTWGSICLKWGR